MHPVDRLLSRTYPHYVVFNLKYWYWRRKSWYGDCLQVTLVRYGEPSADLLFKNDLYEVWVRGVIVEDGKSYTPL